jgi:hypothetical protein
MFSVNKNPSVGDLRKFGRAMVIGFAGLALVMWFAPWLKTRNASVLVWSATDPQIAALVLLALGLGLCILGYAAPGTAKLVYVGWMSVAVPVGLAMSMVLLTVLFVFLLPVFSLVVRLGDPLRKKLRGDSYWEDYKPHEPTLERMRRPF